MKRRMILGEKGVFSVFGICALGTLLFFSATLYAVSSSHLKAERRFLARTALRNAAEDGVRLAVARMNEDAAAAAKANGARNKKELLLTTKADDALVEVFARKKENEILLLGVGHKREKEKDEDRARTVGVVKEKEGKYVIEHWER